MSITDSCQISLRNPENTVSAGASLAQTLYTFPVTVLISGELGTGKTTFLRGLVKSLGIRDPIVSPTFALEQRYRTPLGELAHLDLYRLTTPQARELLLASEEHCSVRCIEWPERLDLPLSELFPESITITLQEEGDDRCLSISFNDAPLPSFEEITTWRNELLVPLQVTKHCDAVAAFIDTLIPLFLAQNRIVRPHMLRMAALTHDLFRFLDFKKNTYPMFTNTEKQERHWAKFREMYPGLSHENACEKFLTKQGYTALGRIVRTHGLALPSPDRATIEQKILFYADKRVKMDTLVSLDERFADYRSRYGRGEESERSKQWYDEAKELEKELFPEGKP